MTLFSSKKADTYLQTAHKDLQYIFSKVKKLDSIYQALSTYLGPHIANKCHVANISGPTLTLLAANGSIATMLRYQTLDLLKKFKHDPLLQHISDIQYKVQFPGSQASRHDARPKPHVPLLSKETAQMIHHAAETIDHPKLKEVMKKIATRCV